MYMDFPTARGKAKTEGERAEGVALGHVLVTDTGSIDFLTNEARLITALFLGTERRARAELESGVAARLPASMKDSSPHDDDDEQDREHEARTSDDDDGGTFYGTDDVDGWQLRRIRVAGAQVYQ